MKPAGYSKAMHTKPKTMLTICRMGKGLTALSSVFVLKSQKSLGQKKHSKAAAS